MRKNELIDELEGTPGDPPIILSITWVGKKKDVTDSVILEMVSFDDGVVTLNGRLFSDNL